MTRINVVDVSLLTDQHLMAEYRELPMVMASAKRARVDKFNPSPHYTLNGGHVKFFWNKKQYLEDRWFVLIDELKRRNFQIDPDARVVLWGELDKFKQVEWQPDEQAELVNWQRLVERIRQKPEWYRYYGKSIGQAYRLRLENARVVRAAGGQDLGFPLVTT